MLLGGQLPTCSGLDGKIIELQYVEKVILSCLNCRGQRAKETSVKQMQAELQKEIWVLVVNYSVFLPRADQTTLQILNGHIIRNMPYIPALSNTLFLTERDHIYWTRGTARAMLEHWASYLNLGAP